VRQILPYISVGLGEGNRCIVVVDDYELFDFIEDFLGDECDLSYEYRTSKERPGGEVITMFFPLRVTPEVIEASLSSLSPAEVERIYKLNN
jgi:tRNA threonylcarbamoyladenosine modification (KEOPS) complex Cgi121 subunit